MMKVAAMLCLLSVLVLAVAGAPSKRYCPCLLTDSVAYPGMLTWDCRNLALTDVPTDCFSKTSKNVAEVLFSYNLLKTIRSTTLADLNDIKALRLDNNNLNFVDETSFEFMYELEVFNINHNLDLSLGEDIFAGLEKLSEISTIGTRMKTFPNITASTVLTRVDMRSSNLHALPLQLLSPKLSSKSFYLNLNGNEELKDIAASSLMDLPDDTILNLDTFVLIWARTEAEKQLIVAKPWTANIDLAAATKVCEEDGKPDNPDVCFA